MFPSWIVDLTSTATSQTSQQNQRLIEGSAIDLEVASATYSAPSNRIEFVAKLNSQNEINSSFNAVAYCEGDFGSAETFEKIDGLDTFNFTSECEPDRIELSLQNYPRKLSSSDLIILGYSRWSSNIAERVKTSQNIVLGPLSLSRNQYSNEETTFAGRKINTTVENGELKLAN